MTRSPTVEHLKSHRESLQKRQQYLQRIRSFFLNRAFEEVETPALVKAPGTETHLDFFSSEYQGQNQTRTAYLITSPEYQMKKYLAAGWNSIFQICKVWRNAEGFAKHCPEFTMLEFYRTGEQALEHIMNDIEDLWKELGLGHHNVPFARFSVKDLFDMHAGVQLSPPWDGEKLWQNHPHLHERIPKPQSQPEMLWEDLFNLIWVDCIEPNLPKDQPFFITSFPRPLSLLAHCNDEWAERFEFLVGDLELANGFQEITSCQEYQKRVRRDLSKREILGKIKPPIDPDYANMLDELPPCAGVALGLDRLMMVALQEDQIRNVTAFSFLDDASQ